MKTDKAAEIEALKNRVKAEAADGTVPEKRRDSLEKLRRLLYESIEESDLKWFDLELRLGDRGTRAKGVIKVCSPVKVGGFFVPVTAKETWEKAAAFNALPLTRAIADQQNNEAHDKGTFVEFKSQPYNTHLPGFDLYADKLNGTAYEEEYGKKPVSGSHKLWLLSAKTTHDKAANYGFFHRGKRLPESEGRSGSGLYPEYSVVNGLIAGHGFENYWDYSQLLQLMKDFKWKGKSVDLRKAICTDHDSAVWDEHPVFILDTGRPK